MRQDESPTEDQPEGDIGIIPYAAGFIDAVVFGTSWPPKARKALYQFMRTWIYPELIEYLDENENWQEKGAKL